MFFFLRRWAVGPSPNPRAGESPLISCARLFTEYIHSYSPYLEAVSSICNPRTRHAHWYCVKLYNFVLNWGIAVQWYKNFQLSVNVCWWNVVIKWGLLHTFTKVVSLVSMAVLNRLYGQQSRAMRSGDWKANLAYIIDFLIRHKKQKSNRHNEIDCHLYVYVKWIWKLLLV